MVHARLQEWRIVDSAVFKARHGATHALGPVTRPECFTLGGYAFNHNFFVFGFGHSKLTQ